ncbi:MAG: hypothetical protein J0I19_15890 [Alphaproteobacteria bacterium]|nr:hypothetical protein [Alphaproteobacteria bacterium]
MNNRRPRPIGPVLHTGEPQGIVNFFEGQMLEHGDSGARVLVLKVWDEGKKALLFPLDTPDRPAFEANAAWAVGWDDADLDGPRMVEVYKTGETKPLWAAYVPHFSAACELWKHYADNAEEGFELVIHCQNNDEWQHLEAIGYFRFSGED